MNNLERLLQESDTLDETADVLFRIMGNISDCYTCPIEGYCRTRIVNYPRSCAELRARWLLENCEGQEE